MILNRDEIIRLGLISDGFTDDSLKDASYDLRIAASFDKTDDGKSQRHGDEFDLKPQGIAAVVSKEVIKLPADVCAFASVKTSLCRKGVLAINIGIIDPGWEGPISSVLLNFGKSNRQLRIDDAFLRLTFHTLLSPAKPAPTIKYTRAAYESEIKTKLDEHLAESFMDFATAAEKGSKKFAEDLRGTLIKYVPIAALMLAVLTFFLNFALLSAVSRSMPFDALQTRASALSDAVKKQSDEVRAQNEDLRKQLDAMKTQLDRLSKQKQK